MELGMGKLLWPPEVFWNSTILELEAAANGLAKMHGAEEESDLDPLSRNEMEELIERFG